MKMSKFDIGAEIISIITKGMYPDPKDALREYIQNGVDAYAQNMSVKIRQNTIVVEDDGSGMDHEIMRKAVRVGVSDKNPTKNVGFMGIGIYSAFHLCDYLTIYSRGTKNVPNRLIMDFGKMKDILTNQKEKRLLNEIKSEELMDLQTLLENCISLTDDGDLKSNEFPERGTRIELTKIETEFYKALSNFDEVAEYLRNVIPLKFDREQFPHGSKIEEHILKVCEEKNQKFELVNLKLQVNTKTEILYRPYTSKDFNKIKAPFEPKFFNIETEDEFFGVAWGCLNSVRRIIDNKALRGFILKKQGFSIGNRESLVKYFPNRTTFSDRYSGEVIIVNPKILPNASRNDLEYSPLRTAFFNAWQSIAEQYDELGNEFQETDKANEQLQKFKDELKHITGEFNEYEENPEVLIDLVVVVKGIEDKIKKRIKNKNVTQDVIDNAQKLLQEATDLIGLFQNRINALAVNKKQKQKQGKSKTDIAKDLANINVTSSTSTAANYDSLAEMFSDLGITLDEGAINLIHIVDEMFVQRAAKTKAEYYELLNAIKERFQNE